MIMQAIQGVYDDGILKLDRKPVVSKARVIVLFPEEVHTKMSTEEALRIFHEHAGSVRGDIDFEKEKDEYFNEKHGLAN
jgi:hypothetical protein